MPAPAGQEHRPPLRAFKDFWVKAYQDNVTGLAGMVAYNLLLSVFPLALLALFIAGRVLESPDLEASVLSDLQQLFPNATDATLTRALARIRDSSTGFGVFALVASVWIGSSFWGALDTAFGEIYHVESRSWLRQKWFSFGMLAVVLLFMAATVAVPTLQSLLTTGTEDLPLGLSDVNGLIFGVSLAAGLILLFVVLSLIYWAVPEPPDALAGDLARGPGRHRGHRHRGLRVPRLPGQHQHDRPLRDHVRVRADRAALVLRAGHDPAVRGHHQRAPLRAPRHRQAGDARPSLTPIWV